MVYKLTVFTNTAPNALMVRETCIQVATEDDAIRLAILYSGLEPRVDIVRVG